MRAVSRNYYIINGRLDLSTLDGKPNRPQKVEEKSREYITKSSSDVDNKREETTRNEGPKVYMDQQINHVLKEMGEYFSANN